MGTTASARLRLRPSPTTMALMATADSTGPTLMATASPPFTTTARGRLRPSPTTMVATMVATGPTGPTATAMAALDTTVEKVTTWTTAFHSYMPRPKTITTRNLFQDLQHKTGRY